ncbi:hypothetical protein, partial [Roseburia sp. AF25-25LB]|uniref:hypothetical protein n=1 Tax=Roseburia sp. AF25-25LB TaxID=2293135 RepID=UPI001A9BA18E
VKHMRFDMLSPLCLRALLIQKDVKLYCINRPGRSSLRALLIQKDVKPLSALFSPLARLRALLIQKDVKQWMNCN